LENILENRKKLAFENCKNPFHYLQTVDQKCPISQRTCDCSRRLALQNNKKHEKVRKRRKKHKNISSEDTTGLDYKYGPKTKTKQSTIDKLFEKVKTSSDISREEQDRKKRFKLSA
jgi:uncharacterized protein YcbK (DUF882 family)